MADAPETEHRYPRGAVLRGKYRVERTLGEGGMGVVLLATHLKLEQRVALKVLASPGDRHGASANIHARFAREARAAARLRNEHVVRVLDVDETEDGTPFLVMELLVGSDLEVTLRRDGPMDPARAADYVLQACEGIAEAHGIGIVHRDLKPANLFLAKTEDGRESVKVLDFGIAKAVESEEELSLTATSGVIGSPLYMSPEQLKGSRDIDARTDLWSLGVVLYQLVTGKLPFEATNATTLAALIASEPPTPLARVRPDAPAAYVAAVERCLCKNASERFATVVELARALAELAPGATGSADRVSRVSRAATARKVSLAETQPEESDAKSEAPPRVTADVEPARVTAALTDAPTAGQRTDYGSEVVRKPSTPPPKASRRGALLGLAALLAAVAIAFALRGRMSAETSRVGPASSPPVASAPEAMAPVLATPVPQLPAAPSASASASAPAAAASVTALRKPVKPAGTASAASVRPPSSASPLDIDLK